MKFDDTIKQDMRIPLRSAKIVINGEHIYYNLQFDYRCNLIRKAVINDSILS